MTYSSSYMQVQLLVFFFHEVGHKILSFIDFYQIF